MKRILIVDDEHDIQQIVSVTLQSKGYETTAAHDGQHALDEIARNPPDLVILDLMMPVVSGLEVCRRLRRDEATRDLPIIVMSAAAKESGKSEEFFASGLGVQEFIAKPFDPLDLLGRVEAVLRMRDFEKSKGETAPTPAGERRSHAKVGGPSMEELREMDPSGVVKTFIESWNSGAFEMEYHCLSPAMTGGLPETAYVERRREARAGDDHEQRLTKVHTMTADSDTAHVVVEREDTVRGFSKARSEEYELTRGDRNWQIKTVRPHQA